MKKIASPVIILSWLLLAFVNNTFAQLLKQKDTYTVYINYPDYTIKTSVSNATKKIRVNESLTYYWYASNKIIQTRGDYDGKLVDGLYTSFYLSNNLKEKGNFKNGLKNGKWISWYENGNIDEITNWRNGKRSGQYKKFNPDESVSITSAYKGDRLDGIQKIYKDGEVASQTRFSKGKEVIKNKQQPDENTEKTIQPTPHKKMWKEKWDSLFAKRKEKKISNDRVNEPVKDANASSSEVKSHRISKRKKNGT